MKPAAKYSLITLGVFALLLVLIVPILYVLIVNAGLKSDGKDWAIASGSKRVQEAINHYIEKHGSPPQKLENLIPEFIPILV
jgi:hypothetical protein